MKHRNKIISYNIIIVILIILIFLICRNQVYVGLYIALITITSVVYGSFYIYNLINKKSNQINHELFNISEDGKNIESEKIAFGSVFKNINILKDYIHRINTRESSGSDIFSSSVRKLNSTNLAGEIFTLLEKTKEFEKANAIAQSEAEQRNWASNGLAKFAEILRNNSNNISDFSYQIIINLVKYIKANQGGVFILNENENKEKYFELTGCYAYGRKKFCDSQLLWGEGLIGACALEKDFIYMTDIPDNYLKITSGLGDANPRSLLIVPMILNEEVYGVIELASFELMEPHVIDFVKKIAEIMASSISSVKLAEKTNILLEQMKIQTEALQKQQAEMKMQAEEMQAQDEELRQNLEELQAIQEDAEAKSIEMKGVLNAIDNSMMKAEFSMEGRLLDCNDEFLNILGLTLNELVEAGLSVFEYENTIPDFQQKWSSLSHGLNFQGIVKSKNSRAADIWLVVTFSPILDMNSNVVKILVLSYDITPQKNHEQKIIEQSMKLKEQEEIMQFNMEELQATTEQYEQMSETQLDRIIFLELMLDAFKSPISVIDKTNNKLCFINRAAEEFLGIKRVELNGKFPKEIYDKIMNSSINSNLLHNKKGHELGELFFLKAISDE